MPRVGQTIMPRVGQAPIRCSPAVVPTYMYVDVQRSGRVVFYTRYSSFVTRTINTMVEDYRLFYSSSVTRTFFFFFILRRMGKNTALAHHTSTYFHTRRVSI